MISCACTQPASACSEQGLGLQGAKQEPRKQGLEAAPEHVAPH